MRNTTPTKQVTDAQVQAVMLWHRCTNSDTETANKWAYNKFKHYGVDGKTRPDVCLIRSSEMLLIMAEAKANTSGEGDAVAYLNTLQRARDVQTLTTTTVKNDLLEAIYVERRKELLGEGVTGMYDLNRLQKDATRMASAVSNNFAGHFTWGINDWGTKSGNVSSTMRANDYKYFCQIPQDEISHNDQVSQEEQNPLKGM